MKFSTLVFVVFSFLFFSNLFSESYVEVYGGALFGKVHLDDVKTHDTYDHKGLNAFFHFSTNESIDPRFMGGLKLGTWFSSANCSNSCAKYFGCCLDSNFGSLDYHLSRPQTSVTYTENPVNSATANTDTKFSSNGFISTTSFQLAMRFGAFPSCRHCFGVLQPYLALGPALVIIRQNSSLWVESHIADGKHLGVFIFTDQKIQQPKKTFLAPGIAADIGFRYMISQKVFLDTILKYCYSSPSFSTKNKMKFQPDLNLLSCHLGLGYCF